MNKADKNGSTALMFAVYWGNFSASELLIQAGADVNKTNHYGFTALMQAARCGQYKTLELLIRAGADVNAARQTNFRVITLAALGLGGELKFEWRLCQNSSEIWCGSPQKHL